MAEAIIAICYLLAQHVPSVTELTSTRDGNQHSIHTVTETRCWDLGGGVGRQLDWVYFGLPNKCLAGREWLVSSASIADYPPPPTPRGCNYTTAINQRHLFSSVKTHHLKKIFF